MKRELISALLLSCIELLAANPDLQRQYLMKSGSYPSLDELALEFDDAYKGLVARTDILIPQSIITKINSIDLILDRLSNSTDENAWDEGSLDKAPWTEIRHIATSILQEMELEVAK